ncbi:unnamed protein product [Candidula unifasciata]|uniref:TIR domain-containing protein n=1 Tax=Candidula unifasciata TaxID=100452 RepID=A0A8S3Z2Y5_9EUPU|nr:unnamed protein product [Candidula unifasciata]
MNINDVLKAGSRPDELLRSFRDNFKDCFRCLPCHCYFTFLQDIVASCNSQIDQIKAVLPNDTNQLTISNSSMGIFDATCFLQFHSLRVLTVSKNKKLSTIANSSDSSHVLAVTILHLDSNSVNKIMDRSFVMFPNLLFLDLKHNQIKTISRLTFDGLTNLKYLNLSRNPLSVLSNGSFDHFQQLEILDLSCDKIWNLITPGLFSNLSSLHSLFMNGNCFYAKGYPNEEMGRLTNLTVLSIAGISGKVTLGPEMKNLTKLVRLHVGYSLSKQCCIKDIPDSFLENVPYLQAVRFSKCPLRSVNATVYRNVKHLRSLEIISTYPYDIFEALDGLVELQNSSLKTLRLIGLIKRGCPFICLYGQHARYLKNINLEVIDLSDNRVGYMDMEFITALPHTLTSLVLHGNELIEPALLTDKLSFLEKLILLDLGYYPDPVSNTKMFHTQAGCDTSQTQVCSLLMESYDDCEGRSDSDNTESLEDCKWSASEERSNEEFLYKTNVTQVPPVCTELNSTTDSSDVVGLNVTNLNSLKYSPRSFSATVHKASMLKYLLAPRFLEVNVKDVFASIRHQGYMNITKIDLSYCGLPSLTHCTYMPKSIQVASFEGNYFRTMHEHVFGQNNSLRRLSLSNNVLGNLFANPRKKPFTRMSNLEHLDISTNMIYDLSVNFFLGLSNLKCLIMSDNKLGFLSTNFTKTPELEYLDLRKNAITGISKSSRDELDTIGTNHPLYIELTLNPLRCTCEGLELLYWIREANIHFVSKDLLSCVGDDNIAEDMGNIDDRVRTLQRQCAGKYLIIVLRVASLAVISVLVVFGVMYRYRWQLRYIRNIALSRLIGFRPRDTENSEFRFDAFIVYSEMSRQFVFGDCLRELEVKRGHKVCVDDRDFMPGTYDVSAIVSAIQNSRKTMLILSPDFYDEQFSEYSVKMALMEEIYQKRTVLYLCLYRPLPDDEMSKRYDLLMIMKRNNYMEFPPETETSDGVRQNFWDQLSEKIGHSIVKNLPTSSESEDDILVYL